MMRRNLASGVLASLLVFVVLAGTGCAKTHTIEIDSNTCWVMSVDGQVTSISDDCGPSTFRVAGEIQCVSIRNTTDSGHVRVKIDDGAWVGSVVPYGTANTCR